MLTVVLGYKGHSRNSDCVCLYNGHSGAAALESIKAAGKDIVRVEFFKNPVPTKRRTLIARKIKLTTAEKADQKRLAAIAAAKKSDSNGSTPTDDLSLEGGSSSSEQSPVDAPSSAGDDQERKTAKRVKRK